MQNREVLIWDIRSAVPTILVNPEEGGLGVVTCFSLDGNGTMALGMSRGIELIDYRCINKDFNRCPSPMPVEAIHLSDRVLSAWMYPLITNFFEEALPAGNQQMLLNSLKLALIIEFPLWERQ